MRYSIFFTALLGCLCIIIGTAICVLVNPKDTWKIVVLGSTLIIMVAMVACAEWYLENDGNRTRVEETYALLPNGNADPVYVGN